MSGVSRWLLLSLSVALAACGVGGPPMSDVSVDVGDAEAVASDVEARSPDDPAVPERWTVGFSSADRDALAAGWAGPEVSPETGAAFTWATDKTATVRLHLSSPASGTLHLRCAPFVYDSSVAQTAAVRVNGRELDVLTLEPDMADYALPVPGDALVEGDNSVTFAFAYAETPQAHGLGDDARTLAVAFERVGFSSGTAPSAEDR
jgi:hypothetical protein